MKLKRVLFVCVGNCCRSQMAEGFANAYGQDVLRAESAGLAPTAAVAAETAQAMEAKNINIASQFPKKFEPFNTDKFDLIINLSGFPLPQKIQVPVREWQVKDPYLQDPKIYGAVCNDIENRVMHLILELRRHSKNGTGRP